MEQVVDLQNSEAFKSLGIQLLSLSPDPVIAWRHDGGRMGISLPMLSDTENEVWLKYGSLDWTMVSGEPGHTFFLVDETGTVAWVRDYGATENGGVMHVPPDDLVPLIQEHLDQ